MGSWAESCHAVARAVGSGSRLTFDPTSVIGSVRLHADCSDVVRGVTVLPRSRGVSAAEYDRYRRQQEREAERRRKAAEAAQMAADRENRRRYVASRLAEAERRTTDLQRRAEELRTFLVRGLSRSAQIDLVGLRRPFIVPPLDLGGLSSAKPPPDWTQFAPSQPGALGRLFGGNARFQRRLAEARDLFERAEAEHAAAERDRLYQVIAAELGHYIRVEEARQANDAHNRSIDALIAGGLGRDRAAVERYLRMVVEAAPVPAGFPRRAEVTYSAEGEQAVMRVELPPPGVIPTIRAVQYVQSRDEDRPLPRPAKEIAESYRQAVSQAALLYLRDVFDADRVLASVSFNGHVLGNQSRNRPTRVPLPDHSPRRAGNV